jgi:hypothetical protein
MKARLRLAATAAVLASFVSGPASAENRTTIQISTVLASNEGRTFDARLSSLKTELKQLRFRSYTLLGSETRVLNGNGGQCGMELPHGRYLNITTREHTPNHLRLHILLNEDNRPVVNTYVKLELGSVVLLGGPRDQEGEGNRKKPASQDAPAPMPECRDPRNLSPVPKPRVPGASAVLPAPPALQGR